MEAFLQKQIKSKSTLSRAKFEEILKELGANSTWRVLRKPGKQERYYDILGGITKKSKKGFAVKKHFKIQAYDGIPIGADTMDSFGLSLYEGTDTDSDTGDETDHITMHYGEDGHRQDYITLYGDYITDSEEEEEEEEDVEDIESVAEEAGYNVDSESDFEIQVRPRKRAFDKMTGPAEEAVEGDTNGRTLVPNIETVDVEGELLDKNPEQVTKGEMTRRPKRHPVTYEPQLARAFHQADSLEFFRAAPKAQKAGETWGDYFYVPSGSGEQTRENAAGLNPINEENKVDQLIRFGGKLYKLLPDYEPVNCNLVGTGFPQSWLGTKQTIAVPNKRLKLDTPMIKAIPGQEPLEPDFQQSYRESSASMRPEIPAFNDRHYWHPHNEIVNPNRRPPAGDTAAKRANFIYRTYLDH